MSGLITLVVIIWLISFIRGSQSGKKNSRHYDTTSGFSGSRGNSDKHKQSKPSTRGSSPSSAHDQSSDQAGTYNGYTPESGTLADKRYRQEKAESSSSLSSVFGTDACTEKNHGVNALRHASNKKGVIVKGCSQTTAQLIEVMEDRENDWLAKQLREEARLKDLVT